MSKVGLLQGPVGLGETRCPKYDYHRSPQWLEEIRCLNGDYCEDPYWFGGEWVSEVGLPLGSILVWERSGAGSGITTGIYIGYGKIRCQNRDYHSVLHCFGGHQVLEVGYRRGL